MVPAMQRERRHRVDHNVIFSFIKFFDSTHINFIFLIGYSLCVQIIVLCVHFGNHLVFW